jgi:hypothetical protein
MILLQNTVSICTLIILSGDALMDEKGFFKSI